MYALIFSILFFIVSLAMMLTAKNKRDELLRIQAELNAEKDFLRQQKEDNTRTEERIQSDKEYLRRQDEALDQIRADLEEREKALRQYRRQLAEEEQARQALLSYDINTAYGIILKDRGE